MGLINTLKKLKEKLYLEKCYYFDYPKLCTKFNFSVLTNDETIEKILAEKPSVSRFGDGEFALMEMQNIGFQKADEGLAKRLRDIIGLQEERLLVCITDIMIRNKEYVRPTLRYHAAYVKNHFERLKQNIPEGRTYGCTNFTRFYADYANKDHINMQSKIDRIMSIWGGTASILLKANTLAAV